MIAAFLSAIGNVFEVMFDKTVLKGRSVSGSKLMYFQLIFIFTWAIIPFLLWGRFSPLFFTPIYLTLLTAMVLISVIGNYSYFYSLSKENVCEVEPIALLSAPLSALLASIIFPSERNLYLIIIILLAAAALIFSRFEKHHLRMSKYSAAMFLHMFCVAVEIVIIKVMLTVSSPVGLYTVRVGLLVLILTPFLFREFKNTSNKVYRNIFLIGGITAFEYFARYFAIGQIGVVKSSLIFLLGPILILIFSNLYLKEKITLRRGLGDAIIIMLVAVTIFI